MSVYVTPAAASQGKSRGQEQGQEKQDANQIQYLDAEVQVIDGQPVLKVETEEGYTSYEFPWPETAFALDNGEKIALERQGSYFMLPASDSFEKVSIEEFQVAMVAGQIMLVTHVNPLLGIPVAVAVAALKKAGIAVTTAAKIAAAILIAAGRSVTKSTVRAVINSWPIIRTALLRAGKEATWWAVKYSSFKWAGGICIIPHCTRRTPGGFFGDLACTVHGS